MASKLTTPPYMVQTLLEFHIVLDAQITQTLNSCHGCCMGNYHKHKTLNNNVFFVI